MKISEIKQYLNIQVVLAHYKIAPNKNGLANCPFHSDTKPSLQLYPATNTWHCFGCGKGRDAIDLIKYMENCTMHEAILKAKTFLNQYSPSKTNIMKEETRQITQEQRIQGLTAAFKYFAQSLKATAKAQEYLKSRAMDYRKITAGYDSHNFHKSKEVTKELQQLYLDLGLIFPDKHGRKDNYHSRFDGCIVFPTFDEQGNIVSMYGRKTEVKESNGSAALTTRGAHYKLPGEHQGLYPKYPAPNTETLIITECIIDAATLLQHEFIAEKYTILSLYGAKIWTEEHSKAIANLHQLKEIIFALDGDKEGKEGTAKHAETVKQSNAKIKISYIEIPEGEDINSIAQGHSPEIFTELINNRKPINNAINTDKTHFFLSPEKKEAQKSGNGNPQYDGSAEEISVKEKNAEPEQSKENTAESPSANGQAPHPSALNTQNPHKLIYRTITATYYIKGGLRKDLESMRVSIDIENNQTKMKKRERIDLYIDKLTEKLSREAAEKLCLRADLIEMDLSRLTDLLDHYRDKLMQEEDRGENPRDKTLPVPQGASQKAMSFLQHPELFRNLFNKISQAGLVGEEKSRMLVLCIAGSNKMRHPLHGIIQGTSGEGKTYLMTTICEMMPPEYWKSLTTLTDKSLFNMKKYQIHRHLMTIEDRVGMSEEVRMYFRELISKGQLIRDTTVSDKDGNYSTKTQIIMGPIASITCTTEAEIHQDDANRCFLISIDESPEQRKRIIEHCNRRSAGMIDAKKEEEEKRFIQNCMRLLIPCEVVNPYATKVSLPDDAKDLIRLHNLFIGLIEQITLIHQYQRKKDGQGRLLTQIEDVEMAVDVMFDAIVLKVDDLNEKQRKFFEQLKQHVKTNGGEQYERYHFKQKEIRMATGTGSTILKDHFRELTEMEYIEIVSMNQKTGFTYRISCWDNYAALRTRIKAHLHAQTTALRAVQNGGKRAEAGGGKSARLNNSESIVNKGIAQK